MITEVIKRDGSVEPFVADKLNKWAEYAQEVGTSWSEIALQTFKKLTNPAKSEDIHQSMINSCIEKKTLAHSRFAARLEEATVRKNMEYILGLDVDSPLELIIDAFEDFGLWDSDTIPPYNPKWQKVYNKLKQIRLEFWQWKQWNDKYACKIEDNVVETPYLGYLGIALALFGDTKKAYAYAEALTHGKINLPTPALNGLRNGDFDTISCCVVSSNDTVESIGVADEIAYRMTAKKAGIGIEFTTRSKDDPVKGGKVKHLGKHPIYKRLERTVKVMTQITRGGNATTTVYCIDPEVRSIVSWKGQKVDIETRIDKLDYSFGYNDAFVDAVVKDKDWYLFSLQQAPDLLTGPCHFMHMGVEEYHSYVDGLVASGVKHTKIKARDLVKQYLSVRQETGRFYDINLTRVNRHTPFKGTIRQSNLCLEIALITKGYPSMYDLYATEKSEGETAFCALSAINYYKTSLDELEVIAELALEAVDIMIDRAPAMSPSMKESMMRRRSVGIGITGLASCMYKHGYDYDGSEESLNFVQTIAEHHYFYLLRASQKLAKRDKTHAVDIKEEWLPVDTAIGKSVTELDWESLRGIPRKHTVLVAHMPTESSALLSGASNGLYPVRTKIVTKQSRKGFVQFICEDFDESKHMTAWKVDNKVLSKYYARVQDYTDQAISCDFYEDPDVHPGGKVPMSKLMKEWVTHARSGNKTRYYANTKDSNGGSIQQQYAASGIMPAIVLDPHGTGFSNEPSTINIGGSAFSLSSLGIEFDPTDAEGCESCKL